MTTNDLDTICTNPRDPRFFEGTSLEKRLSVLRHQSPEKYHAVEIIVLEALRDEFLRIGPDPRLAR